MADFAKPVSGTSSPVRNSDPQDIISLKPSENSEELQSHDESLGIAFAMSQAEYETKSSPPNSSDPSNIANPTSTPLTASERLAEINDRVNKILAPVHALEALKFISPSPPEARGPNATGDLHLTSQSMQPQMPSANPAPARGRGRQIRGTGRRIEPAASGTITLASSVPGTLLTPPSYRARGRGGSRGRGSRGGRGGGQGKAGKRRREDGTVSSDSDASENFTPLTQSRSGRKIIQASQPAPSTPIIKIEDEDAKASPTSRKTNGSSGGRGSGKKRIAFRKTPGGASAVCKNCGRGHSPSSNAIVFCDGCNTPWHQFCHDPPIGKDIVLIAEKEWFCSDCIVMKEERVRLQGKVPGQNLSMLEKRRYLQSLPAKELVSLLLHACLLHPDLPIFNQATIGDGTTEMAEEYYEDEDLLPYPKAGNGVNLRPEKERLDVLLDDDTEVFSHTTTGIAEMVAAADAQNLIPNINGRSISLAA